jgi:hypothetical protein
LETKIGLSGRAPLSSNLATLHWLYFLKCECLFVSKLGFLCTSRKKRPAKIVDFKTIREKVQNLVAAKESTFEHWRPEFSKSILLVKKFALSFSTTKTWIKRSLFLGQVVKLRAIKF